MDFYMTEKSGFDSSSSQKFANLHAFVESAEGASIASVTYGPPNATSEDASSDWFDEFTIP